MLLLLTNIPMNMQLFSLGYKNVYEWSSQKNFFWFWIHVINGSLNISYIYEYIVQYDSGKI